MKNNQTPEETAINTQIRRVFSKCEFTLGVTNPAQLPESVLPEIAFAGRSNVGKSSLINAITGRKALARVSVTPGRTGQLNFFLTDSKFHIVDMPGYGYAKVSKQQRKQWDGLIFDYLRGRPNLRTVYVLIDSRHGIKDNDKFVFELLDLAAVNYRVILTKSDKADKSKLADIINETENKLKKHPAAFPIVRAVSSHKKTGIDEICAEMIEITSV